MTADAEDRESVKAWLSTRMSDDAIAAAMGRSRRWVQERRAEQQACRPDPGSKPEPVRERAHQGAIPRSAAPQKPTQPDPAPAATTLAEGQKDRPVRAAMDCGDAVAESPGVAAVPKTGILPAVPFKALSGAKVGDQASRDPVGATPCTGEAPRPAGAGPIAGKPITNNTVRWSRAFLAAGWPFSTVAFLFGVDPEALSARL